MCKSRRRKLQDKGKRLVCSTAWLMLSAAFCSTALAQTIQLDGEIFRDPTQPPWAMSAAGGEVPGAYVTPGRVSLESFDLSFVRAGGLSPVAVINDQQVTVGDEIDGVPVLGIRPGEVILMIDGQEQVLSSFSRPVRTAVGN